jgi:hypothetical protein
MEKGKMISTNIRQQTGLAMITAMMVLIALTLIILSGAHNGIMQLRMSSNLESRMEAVQTAQAGLDFADSVDPTSITTGLNYVCYGDMNSFYVASITAYASNCGTIGTLPSPIDNYTGLIMVRDNALEGDLPPNMATSIGLIEVAYFRAYSGYDNSSNGQGRVILGAGVMKLKLTDAAFK